MKFQKNLFLLFFIVSGIVVGSMVAAICVNIPVLSWLSYSASVGFAGDSPALLDLAIIKLYFGFSVAISIAQILFISLALFLFTRLVR